MALIRFIGTPEIPNPPAKINDPSLIPSIASEAVL